MRECDVHEGSVMGYTCRPWGDGGQEGVRTGKSGAGLGQQPSSGGEEGIGSQPPLADRSDSERPMRPGQVAVPDTMMSAS